MRSVIKKADPEGIRKIIDQQFEMGLQIAGAGLIASFSRALSEGLNADQTAGEFDHMLAESIREIYEASIT